MFSSDIVIYNFLKKVATKIIPVFGVNLLEIPIGGLLFDVVIILSLAFTALAKANKTTEKVKK